MENEKIPGVFKIFNLRKKPKKPKFSTDLKAKLFYNFNLIKKSLIWIISGSLKRNDDFINSTV